MAQDSKLRLDNDNTELVSCLLARIVHDFNNPLAAILGFSELLGNPSLNEEKKARYAKRIHEQASRLSQLVEMMSSFSALPDPKPAEMELQRVTRELLSIRTGSIQTLQVDLHEDFFDGQILVMSDRAATSKIITALLNNLEQVFKENPNAPKRAGVRTGKLDDFGYVDFIDHGPGVPQNLKEEIFQPFFSTRRSGGLGLGLTVARCLARRMGGDVTLIDSPNPEAGATFRFTAPLA